jgi:hypothetical protein
MATGPSEYMTIAELKALGRSRIIELARKAALETGSRMVPPDDLGQFPLHSLFSRQKDFLLKKNEKKRKKYS